MNNKRDVLIYVRNTIRTCFGIPCISSSKRVVLGCLLIGCSYFILIRLNITQHTNPSTEKESQFYSVNSSEIGRVASGIFPSEKVYHINNVAYDRYSISELGQTTVGRQWLTFPLPSEINRTDYPPPWLPTNHRIQFPIKQSPKTITGLAYLERIYVITDQSFTERHEQLNKTFRRHSIPIESINYRFKWNRTTCKLKENFKEIEAKLHRESASHIPIKYCPIIMKHVDVWHEMVSQQVSLALILEDDAIFVPFFKEKFNRFIYTAIRTGALKLNRTCLNETENSINDQEWFNQEPMFVIGICFLDMRDPTFQTNQSDAQPILTTKRRRATRCAHAYLVTSCSAKAMIETIKKHKTYRNTPDELMDSIVPRSPILQSFWLDPPLVYQGNTVIDVEQLETFRGSTYNKKF